MNTLLICLSLSICLSSGERLEDFYRSGKLDGAETLIRAEIPPGSAQIMALARLAVRRNDLKESVRLYRELLTCADASPVQKTTALFALLSEAEKRGGHDEILKICTEADALLPKGTPGKRRFVFARARALEKMNNFDKAGEVYSSLLAEISEESPWEQAGALYLGVLAEGKLPVNSELKAKLGAARMLEKTNHADLAESVLFSIYKSKTLPPRERGESAVAITEFLERGKDFGKWENQKKIDEFLRDNMVSAESKARILDIQAEHQLHSNKNFGNARNFWSRAAYLPGLPKPEQAKIFLKCIAAAEQNKHLNEAFEFRKRIFHDGSHDKNLRFKMLEPMARFLASEKKFTDAEKLLTDAGRFRNLSEADRDMLKALRANLHENVKSH